MKVIAFEGMNGSGKSTVLESLDADLKKNGFSVCTFKIAGFGKSKQVQALYPKLQELERKRKAGQLSPTDYEEYSRNTIIRKTIAIQISEYREYISSCLNKPDFVLLDRSPMISWIYSTTIPARRSYIQEILDEAIMQTESLSIDDLIVLDVEPWMSYARMFCRSIGRCDMDGRWEERIREICVSLGIPATDIAFIFAYLREKIRHDTLLPEIGRQLDLLIPHTEVNAQRKSYSQLGMHIGCPIHMIDAMGTVEEVKKTIKQLLNL